MSKYIVHHEGQFLEWSTVVDAPITFANSLSDFEAYYREEYGEAGMIGLPVRIERAIKNGTSAVPDMSLKELVRDNRAGPNETKLSLKDVIRFFFVEKREP